MENLDSRTTIVSIVEDAENHGSKESYSLGDTTTVRGENLDFNKE